ncbi:MAG: hypothetical protein AAGA87_16395 [Pseudomonadota bacterium]
MTRWILVGLAAFCSCAWLVALVTPDVPIRITQERVAAAIDDKLPFEIDTRALTLDVENASVKFLETGKVGVTAQFEGRAFGLSGKGAADTESGLRYEGGRFYLADLSVEDLSLVADDDSQGVIDDARTTAGALFHRLRGEAEEADPEAPESMDRLRDRAVERMKPIVAETMDRWVQAIPVYDLDSAGLKGQLAKLALKDIRISEGQAVVLFSPAEAIAKIISVVVAVVLCLLIVVWAMRAWSVIEP